MKFKTSLRMGAAALVFAAGSMGLVPAQADHHGAAIKAALENPDRPDEDKARDVLRKPGEVLAFAGIAPGMTVLDINASGGYYTELLSRIVGSEGKVYSHNGAVYWAFMGKKEPARLAGGKLANVVQVHNDKETFDEIPEGSVDAAMMVLAFHDYFFTHKARPGGGHEDVSSVLASLKRVLKPGGTVTIIDHIAPPNSGPAEFDKLHRMDPAFVREKMEEAGFEYLDKSTALISKEDDPTVTPFAKTVRGRTSRFIYKFGK
ncbi:MAG: class I SAM-dependent methyltransferase [Alphaproteobacteria bacterium]|nr:class I SAM-dependent methyltransferase [Alphaproteobacteria bacterium]